MVVAHTREELSLNQLEHGSEHNYVTLQTTDLLLTHTFVPVNNCFCILLAFSMCFVCRLI